MTVRREPNETVHSRRAMLVGGVLIVLGTAISLTALSQIAAPPQKLAQANQQPAPPAESMPGGTRPTTPAPEPARPVDATTGASPPASQTRPPETGTPLPPAPAEKMGEPVRK
jgi:hypothetical protein